jgi:hypothetical protein
MSLSSFLETSEVRRRFREEFEKPAFEAGPELVAPPVSDRPSHVGMAFDYLLRFHLRRLNPEVAEGRQWVAESALKLLSGPEEQAARETVEWAKTARDDYVASGNATREVFEAVLHLARLDLVVRTAGKKEISTVEAVTEDDIEDLRQLHESIPEEDLRADDICLLNPTFGKASRLVGGADADLLLGDTLIEVKTLKEASLSRDTFNQLLGYYTLHIIDGIGELEEKPTIDRIGIYFSRHKHLHFLCLAEVVDRSTYPDFVEWFATHAISQYISSD